MRRWLIGVVAAVSLGACAHAPVDEEVLRVVASGSQAPALTQPAHWVIESPEALAALPDAPFEATDEAVAAAFKQGRTLVLFAAGERGSSGYGIEVEAQRVGDTVHLQCVVQYPQPGMSYLMVMVQPWKLVAVSSPADALIVTDCPDNERSSTQ